LNRPRITDVRAGRHARLDGQAKGLFQNGRLLFPNAPVGKANPAFDHQATSTQNIKQQPLISKATEAKGAGKNHYTATMLCQTAERAETFASFDGECVRLLYDLDRLAGTGQQRHR